MSRPLLTHATRWAHAQVGRPWKLGETDCFAVTRAMVLMLKAVDPFPEGTWTIRHAQRLAAEYGGVLEYLESRGWTRHRASAARSGDVVAMPLRGLDGFCGVGAMVGGLVLTSCQREGVVLRQAHGVMSVGVARCP